MENKFSCMGDGVSAPLNKLRSFKLNLDRMSNFERSLYGLFLHVDGEMEGVPKNVTKVQHYIPQEYLKAWCQTDSKQIAYREKSDAPMMRSYETVAYEKYGYKFQDLSYDEIELLMRGAFDESFGHIALMKHLVGTLVFPGLIRRLVEKDSFDDACKSLHFLCDLNALRPKQLEVANEILTIGFSQGTLPTKEADVFTQGTLPTKGNGTSVLNGITSATSTQPTFTGTGAELKASFSGSSLTSTGNYTPEGEISGSISGFGVSAHNVTDNGHTHTISGSGTINS